MIAKVVCVIVGGVMGVYGSMYAAAWLFTLNAHHADAAVRAGMAFQLYVSVVAGWVMGILTAAGFITRSPSYCIYCGAITAIILLGVMFYYSHRTYEFWEGPDLVALPLLLAVLLLARGVKLKSR